MPQRHSRTPKQPRAKTDFITLLTILLASIALLANHPLYSYDPYDPNVIGYVTWTCPHCGQENEVDSVNCQSCLNMRKEVNHTYLMLNSSSEPIRYEFGEAPINEWWDNPDLWEDDPYINPQPGDGGGAYRDSADSALYSPRT